MTDGVYSEGSKTSVYDGKADFQEGISKSHALRLDKIMGLDVQQIEGTIYIEDVAKLKNFNLEDVGVITFENEETIRVEIIGIQRLGSLLFVRKAS